MPEQSFQPVDLYRSAGRGVFTRSSSSPAVGGVTVVGAGVGVASSAPLSSSESDQVSSGMITGRSGSAAVVQWLLWNHCFLPLALAQCEM